MATRGAGSGARHRGRIRDAGTFPQIPGGAQYKIVYDLTQFVAESIRDIQLVSG
jgi:hypothetical protein